MILMLLHYLFFNEIAKKNKNKSSVQKYENYMRGWSKELLNLPWSRLGLIKLIKLGPFKQLKWLIKHQFID